MNERIQELAYQAEDYADTMVDGGSEFHPVFVKKFAELIVKECLVVITPTKHDTGSYIDFSNGLTLAQIRIGKHFGVEE